MISPIKKFTFFFGKLNWILVYFSYTYCYRDGLFPKRVSSSLSGCLSSPVCLHTCKCKTAVCLSYSSVCPLVCLTANRLDQIWSDNPFGPDELAVLMLPSVPSRPEQKYHWFQYLSARCSIPDLIFLLYFLVVEMCVVVAVKALKSVIVT